jgi:lipopolysaccharide export system permease protein
LTGGRLLGRYLLAQIAQPFSATLLVVLPALLLERLLRLFDLIASRSVPGAAVLRMLLDLVPHYLGLALPAALFASIAVVVSRLSANNELDAMQNAGLSLRRISLPFAGIGALAALLGFGLYSYAQPYARYAYRAAFQAAVDGAWNATVPAGEITRISPNLVIAADTSDQASGRLGGVTIYQRKPDGTEQVTTARTGLLALSPDGTELLLTLQQASRLDRQPDGTIGWLTSPSTAQRRPFVLPLHDFRARGLDEREMTLGELWAARRVPAPAIPRGTLDGELHGRVLRALSLAVLPLLAVPFGLAAKRTGRQYGMVVGVVLLVLYYHGLQLAQSLGAARHVDPRPLLWGAFAAFTAFCVGIFHRAERHTAEGPLDGLFDALDRLTAACLGAWRGLRARIAA